jgi:hypothetical protein
MTEPGMKNPYGSPSNPPPLKFKANVELLRESAQHLAMDERMTVEVAASELEELRADAERASRVCPNCKVAHTLDCAHDKDEERAAEIGDGLRGAPFFSLLEALRRDRPRTAQGYVHVGAAVLDEAAERLEWLEAERDELRRMGWEAGERAEKLRAFLYMLANGEYRDMIGAGDLTVADQMRADARAAIEADVTNVDTQGDGVKKSADFLNSDEPTERIQAAMERCRRFEEERGPDAAANVTNDGATVFQARGEIQAATYIRELLEQPLLDTEEGK